MSRITKALVVVGGLALLSTLPHACYSTSTSSRDSVGSSSTVALRLPHPAFAYASTKSSSTASIADIAEQATASVVNISSVKVIHQRRSPFFSDPFFRRFFEGFGGQQAVPREQRQRSLGSGVIVTKDGVVLTNNHVVDKADEIKVHLHDGRDLAAKIIGTDPKSDLAVLRLEGDVKDLRPLSFGNSDRLRLGDVVLAIGNPFGVGQTVTMGIVSAKGRANVGIVDYEDFIQTDAAINPGNSGGALVNMEGQLVGINTAILSRSGGYQGIGFAIPSNMAKAIQSSILKFGKVVRGWLGIAIQELTGDLAKALNIKNNRGVLVSDVQANSPAARGGLKRGDVILSINGTPTDSTGKLRNLVAIAGAGHKVKVELLRDGKRTSLELTLGELESGRGNTTQISKDQGVLGGLTVSRLDSDLKRKYRLPDQLQQGVVVVGVEQDTPAAQAGLREGDVLLEINRRPISSAKSFSEAYRQAEQQVLLLVFRQGSTLYMLLRK
ncbi:MAG: DegQ family serine endoprotease [Deltaproteobacteria bacterium]|nr:DegQ family serine endoprotease [Deltaproteobacteria bacterium]